jgi:RNase adapter protein RapZ
LREEGVLDPLRKRADVLVDTSQLTPHQLRDQLVAIYSRERGAPMAVSVQSFSYKRGLPRGADMVFDCRFLHNPHWQPDLRPMDGRNAKVAAFIHTDPRFAPFNARVSDLVLSLLEGFVAEGKSSLTIAFGCTGGQHRSVLMAETLSKTLADAGWQVSKRHREIERGAGEQPALGQG